VVVNGADGVNLDVGHSFSALFAQLRAAMATHPSSVLPLITLWSPFSGRLPHGDIAAVPSVDVAMAITKPASTEASSFLAASFQTSSDTASGRWLSMKRATFGR
jgi:hypothetical protein